LDYFLKTYFIFLFLLDKIGFFRNYPFPTEAFIEPEISIVNKVVDSSSSLDASTVSPSFFSSVTIFLGAALTTKLMFSLSGYSPSSKSTVFWYEQNSHTHTLFSPAGKTLLF